MINYCCCDNMYKINDSDILVQNVSLNTYTNTDATITLDQCQPATWCTM